MTRIQVWRRTFTWAAQLSVFLISGILSFLLRFDFSLPTACLTEMWFAIRVWMVVKILVFAIGKLDRGLWEYVGIVDLVRLGLGNLIASTLSFALVVWLCPQGFPRSIYALDFLCCFIGTAAIRVVIRVIKQTILSGQSDSPGRRALIYGAGCAGIMLLEGIRNDRLAYDVCGFIDDKPEMKGLRIAGVAVLGGGDKLDSIVHERNIEIVLIAVPSAAGSQISRILELCHRAHVDCKTIPGLGELIEGPSIAGQIRVVAVDDLLGRTPIQLELTKICAAIRGKIVLVTGGAGSIGSELCRQIARFGPSGIIGFDIAESPLYEVDREMKKQYPNVPFYPEIGNIQNRIRLDEVLRKYNPRVVYHAAAYKHVPLMEEHAFEAIENNVLGTYYLAQAAYRHGVENFVMISSDKAVRPTNVMGASKRIAELLLLSLQNGGTQYVAVRFGNVLGSNGSVIPIFKKQISAGGPVTVTHPEMRRFFMTIPEACQLVLQASTIGKGGQICVLEMGEPIKIADLARNLIYLSGLRPDDDIKIQFTGIRPGEKLYEELSSLLEGTVPSEHEKIRIFVGDTMPETDVESWVDSLKSICESRDLGRLVVALKQIVHDYNPSTVTA